MPFQKTDFTPPSDAALLSMEVAPGLTAAGRTFTSDVDDRPQPMEHQRSIGYFGWFDTLRAILALAVFVSHAGILPEDHPIADLGSHAVRVFFALSGFLVGGILLNKAQQRETFWAGVPRFYFNRCVRIWVPYYLLIAVYLALVTARGFWSEELVQRLVPALAYTHNWANYFGGLSEALAPINHMWSLAVEEQFYLLCPLLVGVISDRRLVIALMIGITALLPLYFNVHYYSCIALGVAAAAAHQMMPANEWRWLQQFGLYLGIPAFFVMMFFEQENGSMLIAITATLVVIGCSSERPGTKLTYLLGAMSYSFYLFHWLGLYLANPVGKLLPDAIALPVSLSLALAVSVCISYASVKMIEQPLLQKRDSIALRFPWLINTSMVVAGGTTLFGLWWAGAL